MENKKENKKNNATERKSRGLRTPVKSAYVTHVSRTGITRNKSYIGERIEDSRANLRKFFEVDTNFIVYTTLAELAINGK